MKTLAENGRGWFGRLLLWLGWLSRNEDTRRVARPAPPHRRTIVFLELP